MAKTKRNLFDKFANAMTQFTGSSTAFISAVLVILIWAITGPVFGYSETWQLIINTGTTIITFLMVFLIQKAQNKDGKAIQLKLNELLAATQGASNRMVSIEDLNEEELNKFHVFYKTLARLEENQSNLGESRSIDAAHVLHEKKHNTGTNPIAKKRTPAPKPMKKTIQK